MLAYSHKNKEKKDLWACDLSLGLLLLCVCVLFHCYFLVMWGKSDVFPCMLSLSSYSYFMVLFELKYCSIISFQLHWLDTRKSIFCHRRCYESLSVARCSGSTGSHLQGFAFLFHHGLLLQWSCCYIQLFFIANSIIYMFWMIFCS